MIHNIYEGDGLMRKSMYFLVLIMLVALVIAGCGGGEDEDAVEPAPSTGDSVAGEPLFKSTCSACHGPDAKGLPNLGKDLTTSDFLITQSDDEILAFIKIGRPSDHPDNTQGVDMPPKGGNPALDDDDILNIIAYLRSLEQ
jgi:disulfide bond formation protein DsbB